MLLRLLGVYQVVRVVVQRLADDEGPFPWGGKFVLAGDSLDLPEYQVTFVEGKGPDTLVVVVEKLLLVDGRPAQSQLACFLEQGIDVFSFFFCIRLRIQDDSRRVEFDVRGDDRLETIQKEEQSETG